jgi:hypothetical protein
MIYPGGWNDLEISEPRLIKPIISNAIIDDGTAYPGAIVNSVDYFTPTAPGWVASPFALNAEPLVYAVNAAVFLNELYKATAMNQQTKMSNITNAPPPLANMLYLYGNNNGNLSYQMKIDIDLGAGLYNYLELSVMENAASSGGVNGVVQAYHFAKTAGTFTGIVTLELQFDNFFGSVNLGLRAESTAPASSIFELRCQILSAQST